jgi:hypothetical protein
MLEIPFTDPVAPAVGTTIAHLDPRIARERTIVQLSPCQQRLAYEVERREFHTSGALVTEDWDLLTYWVGKKPVWPHFAEWGLKQLSRICVAADAERLFSSCGRKDRPGRSSMTIDTMGWLVILDGNGDLARPFMTLDAIEKWKAVVEEKRKEAIERGQYGLRHPPPVLSDGDEDV